MTDSITEQLKEVEKQMEEVNHYGLIATIKEDGTDGHFFLMGNSHRLSQFLAAICKSYPDFKEVIEDALELAEEQHPERFTIRVRLPDQGQWQ